MERGEGERRGGGGSMAKKYEDKERKDSKKGSKEVR